MKRFILVFLAACLWLPYTAMAADAEADSGNSYYTGEIGAEVRLGDTTGSKAKANEYTRREGGMTIGVQLDVAGPDLYQFNLDGVFDTNTSSFNSNNGFQRYDYDFSASFKKIDSYKINAYAQRIAHNMSDGRSNRYDGDAGSKIWGTGSVTDFTFNRVRTNAGLGLEASFGTPFFASVKLDTKQVEGILPLTNVSNGFSTYPLDYEVNMVSGQFGYRANNLVIKLDGSFDKMENHKNVLRASTAATAQYKMPNPESENYKVGASLSWRIPSISSSLMASASFANMTSDWLDSSRGYSNGVATAAWDDYKGDIKNTNINVTFTSNPTKGLNTKVYVRYFDRDNDSKIKWKSNATATDIARSKLAFYEYDRLTAGAEVAYRFLSDYKIAAGYEFEGTDRNDYGMTKVSNTDDNKLWARFDATFNDVLAGHLRYQFMDRDSSKTKIADNTNTPSSWYIAPWFSYADTASKQQHEIKAGVDITPLENLAFGLEYVFTYDDYDQKQQFGMNEAYKHGLIADISYDFGQVRLGMYGGVEYGKSKVNQRAFTSLAGADPGFGNTATQFNWDFKQEDTTWSFGVNSNMALIKDVLDFEVRYDLVHNDGKTELSAPAIAGLTRGNIRPVDKYTEHMLSAKLSYTVAEQHTFGLGYYFSHLKYKDWAYDDVSDANKLTDSYYNVKSSYETHAVGLSYKYKF